MRSKFVLRVRLISGLFILFAFILATRLYFVQIVHGDGYRAEAVGQYVEDGENSEHRGEIFFTRKDGTSVAAAVMQVGWKIAIRPGDLANPDATYAALSSVVDIDRDRFFSSVEKKDDPYEELRGRVDDDAARTIREKEMPGVLTVRDEWRMYPGNDLAAHAIGFVGYNGERREGVYGIEKYYQDTLKREGSSLYVNPFAEIFTNVAAVISSDPGNYQGNVITSIEPDVEIELERVLGNIMKEYSPRSVGGIIMDPSTGEILGIGVLPDFNPNTYNTEENARVFTNPIVESRYEMGSIMKPLTVAAGIDTGAIAPGTTYEDKGFIYKSGYRIANYDGKGRGRVAMQEILSQSLNTGVSFIVDRMGHDTFADYFEKYGLGEETGIDLPGEIAGDISAITGPGAADVDFASASFGQGIATTPIEMIRALASLANGGVLPEPHVATHIQYPSGIMRETPQAPETRVLKKESAETVTNMLVKVFDDALLNGELKQEHYSIAAKTGTAQIGGPGCDGYCEGRFLHSFFGYFPAHDPRFIILLYQVEPQGVQYASQSLARPFMELAKFLINYYEIPPDR
ncbi:penicillin-binding protein 2 [Candidatus Kaiserbacteria bacterium]|nr:penicillin-binding protein 2 [Candidatus Kaiserbacteria bacterium]